MNRICQNKDCEGEYSISEFGGEMPGTKERENIQCPYCGEQSTEMCNGVWRCDPIKAGKIELNKDP